MAKLGSDKTVDRQSGTIQGMDRIVSLLGAAVKNSKVITDSFDTVSKTVDRRKTTDADNAVKVSKAETESKKEDNRHGEAMANIELEYKKVCDAFAQGKLDQSMLQSMIQPIIIGLNRINGMDDIVFLSEEARVSREELHKTMLELYKELIRAR